MDVFQMHFNIYILNIYDGWSHWSTSNLFASQKIIHFHVILEAVMYRVTPLNCVILAHFQHKKETTTGSYYAKFNIQIAWSY